MILTALLTFLSVFLALMLAVSICFIIIKRKFMAIKADAIEIYHDYADSPGEGKPSQVQELIQRVAWTVGHAAAMEIKTTLMGNNSATSRQEAAIVDDIVSDQLEVGNPLVSGLLDQSPRLKKRLLKNPQLLTALMGLMNKSSADGGSSQPASISNSNTKARFNL